MEKIFSTIVGLSMSTKYKKVKYEYWTYNADNGGDGYSLTDNVKGQ